MNSIIKHTETSFTITQVWQELLGGATMHQGFVLWLTGLPLSGKTSLARALHTALLKHQVHTVVLDAYELQTAVIPQPTYSPSEQEWFHKLIIYMTNWLSQSNVNVLVAASAYERAFRDTVRAQRSKFAEIYVHCPVEICLERHQQELADDPAFETDTQLLGNPSRYEVPLDPEVIVDTTDIFPTDGAKLIIEALQKKGFWEALPTPSNAGKPATSSSKLLY